MLLSVLLIAGLCAGCGEEGRDKSSDEDDPRASGVEDLDQLPKSLRDDFNDGDANGDGRLQDTELIVMFEEDFKVSDRNADGVWSAADLPADIDAGASFEPFDMNADGRVTMTEYARHVERDFMALADSDGDGHIDASEAVTYYTERRRGEGSK